MNAPRAFAVFGLLVTLSVAGCVEDGQKSPSISRVFGPDRVGAGNVSVEDPMANYNGTYIFGAAIEGGIVGDNGTNWALSADAWIEPALVTLSKSDPGPAGGGGTEQALTAQANATFMARLIDGKKLTGYTVRWALFRPGDPNLNYSAAQPADATFSGSVNEIGGYYVIAQLYKGETLAATTAKAWKLFLNVHWVVESAVRPVKVQGAPAGPSYASAADEFPFTVPSRFSQMVVETAYRGMYTPDKGADVDLEVVEPGGTAFCDGEAGAGSPAPDPAQSNERTTIPEDLNVLSPGEWLVRVGGMSEENCGAGTYYHNAGMVPYTLNIWIAFDGSVPK